MATLRIIVIDNSSCRMWLSCLTIKFNYKFMKKKRMLYLFRTRVYGKIWKIMKLCVIFVMFFVFAVSARSLGQKQIVTLELTNVSLYELFDAIHKQTGLRFLYNAEQMKAVPSVDVSVKNKKVCDVLTDVLAGTPLTTVFDKDLVMLVKRTEAPQQKAKEIKIVGKVTDTQKQPIPGGDSGC